jgi:hypothetical protein
VWHGGKAIHPPSWGFLFRHARLHRWGKERARRRRVAPGEEGAEDRTGDKDRFTAGTPSTRQGDAAPRRKGEAVNQPGTRSRSRGGDHWREPLPRLRTPLHRAGHDSTAAPK